MKMEEVRRVSFQTISSTAGASTFGASCSMAAGHKLTGAGDKTSNSGGGGNKKKKSFRISVDLFEPDADSFPEYNFRQLLVLEKKKHRRREKRSNGGADHPDDPLGAGEDDDDVARLAREMEEKYGSGSAYSKSMNKRGAVEHFDKGIGYDENDSFIDNTDAYDELIPDEIEPNHGGFYINSGLLEFHNRPNFERPEDAQRMPKARKRTLSTSSEDEAEENQVAKTTTTTTTTNADDNKQLPSDKKNKKKKKKLKEVQNGDHHHHHQGEEKKVSSKPKPPSSTNKEDSPPKTTTVKEMLRLKRDNHRSKGTEHSSGSSSSNNSSDDDEDDGDGDEGEAEVDLEAEEEEEDDNDNDDEDEVEEVPVPKSSSKVTSNGNIPSSSSSSSTAPLTLPADVSKELMQNVIILEQSARLLNGPGENVLTNAASLDILLAIEQETQQPQHRNKNDGKFRTQVYAYLAERLKCSRVELLAKADRMRGHAEEAKGRKLLQKLKKTVEGRMAKLLETYDAECRRVTEMKSTMHVIGFVAEAQNPMHQMQMPRRRFHWTDSSRKLLFEVYEAARGNYEGGGGVEGGGGGGGTNKQQQQQQRKRAKTVEEHLSEFLKQDVLPLWPTGWMKYELLVKEVERRKQALRKQSFIKDVVNCSAFAADGGMVGDDGVVEKGKEKGVVMEEPVVNGSNKLANGGGGVTDLSRSNSLLKQKQQQQQQQQQPPQTNHAKKNSYDYSITNLIGNNVSPPAGGESAQLKIKSVAALNSNSAATLIPTATVIVSCDDDEVEEAPPPERSSKVAKTSATVHAGGAGGVVVAGSASIRAKRTSDSDSSCEIVNVYSSAEGGGKATSHGVNNGSSSSTGSRKNNSSEGGGSDLRTSSSNSARGGGGSTAAVQPIDANDIDVNQIMQDLKDWQQWETTAGGFNAKKTEFSESSRKDLLMMQKAKYMDHLSTLAAAAAASTQGHHHHSNTHQQQPHHGHKNGFK